jgi:PilZ domain
MPFSIRSFRRFPVCCSVTYNTGPFQGQGIVWNLSCTGWRLSGDLPLRPGETLSLTVTLPNEQRIEILEAVVRWSRGLEFAVENIAIEPHIQARLRHYVKRLILNLTVGSCLEVGDNDHSKR